METIWSLEVDKVLKEGCSLNEIGVDNWALNKSKALKAVDELAELKIPILGGDIYEKIESTFQPNYDSWYCDKLQGELEEDFLNRSVTIAKDYINSYEIKNLKDIFFVLVPDI